MNKFRSHKHESGQSLILVTLLLFVFIALLALVIDGAYTYFMRRNAQNAADAGALAGASELCANSRYVYNEEMSVATLLGKAEARAIEYAQARNQAVTAVAAATWMNPGGTVSVTTTIPFLTFWGHLLGQNSITAPAYAKAGCAPPSAGVGVLPIAWSCKAPIGEEDTESDDCALHYMVGDQCIWNTDDPMYIIADSETIEVDIVCADPSVSPPPAGYVDCDLNNDGVNDVTVLSGGDRSWLDLNGGGGGASELIAWIKGGVTFNVAPHYWVPAQTGVTASVYDTVHDYILQKDVIIPVFDLFCEGGPKQVCPAWYHPTLDTVIPDEDNPDSQNYFHLISFSYWRTTCVDSASHKCGQDSARAKLNEILKAAGWSGGAIQSLSTMEGCFVEGFAPGIGGEPGQGVDTGVYNIFLMD